MVCHGIYDECVWLCNLKIGCIILEFKHVVIHFAPLDELIAQWEKKL